MQVVQALDFKRRPYSLLLVQHATVEDARAAQQPWSEWRQVLTLVVMSASGVGLGLVGMREVVH